jgi:hypothetical protein
MRPLVAHCDLRLGSLFEHAGRVTKGRAALHDALRAFADLDMPFWAARTRDLLSKPAMGMPHERSHGARHSAPGNAGG